MLKEITNYNGPRSRLSNHSAVQGKVNTQSRYHVKNSAQSSGPQNDDRHGNATLSKAHTQSNKHVVRLNLTTGCDFPSPPSVAPHQAQPSDSNIAVVAKASNTKVMSTNTDLDLLSLEMTASILKNQPDWQMYTVETSLEVYKESKKPNFNQPVTIGNDTDHSIAAPLSTKIRPVTIYLEKVQLVDEHKGEMSLDRNGFAPPLCSTPIQLHTPTAVHQSVDNVAIVSRQQQEDVASLLSKRQNKTSEERSQSDSVRQRKRKRQRICLRSGKTSHNNGSFKSNKPSTRSITQALQKWTKQANKNQLTPYHKSRKKRIPEPCSYKMEMLAKSERQHKTINPIHLPAIHPRRHDTTIPLCPLLEGDEVNYIVPMINNQSIDNTGLDQLLSL